VESRRLAPRRTGEEIETSRKGIECRI